MVLNSLALRAKRIKHIRLSLDHDKNVVVCYGHSSTTGASPPKSSAEKESIAHSSSGYMAACLLTNLLQGVKEADK